MKKQSLVIALLVATALVAFLATKKNQRSEPGVEMAPAGSEPAAPQSQSQAEKMAAAEPASATGGKSAAQAVIATAPGLENVVPGEGGEPEKGVRVRAGQTLAKVNGAAITWTDLVLAGAAGATGEQVSSA